MSEEAFAAWMFYGIALVKWIDDNLPKDLVRYGLPDHSMSQELYALGEMITIWKILKEESDSLSDPILDDLVLVLDAGFVREYIWEWSEGVRATEEADGLRLNEFSEWRAKHIPNHSFERLADIQVSYDEP